MIAPFNATLTKIDPGYARFQRLRTLQVNVGNSCNQNCMHCHVGAGPQRNECMGGAVVEKIVQFLKKQPGIVLDITGGSPELASCFSALIKRAYPLIHRIMVRTNLTILTEQGMEWLYEFYSRYRVVLIASLPCYIQENVDAQRGRGVFERSIRALTKLNEYGYGKHLELNLVHNPGGDFLPGAQEQLEHDYRRELFTAHGITFHRLFTITNVPLGRFARHLDARGRNARYLRLLVDSFNPAIADKIMCRTLVNVDWKGTLYSCDFNRAAGLPIRNGQGEILSIDAIDDVITKRYEIASGNHCYSCTAGEGSSCTGRLTE